MSRVRLALAGALGAACLTPLGAQRLSVTPFVGWTAPGPLMTHRWEQRVNYPGAGGFPVTTAVEERLAPDPARALGARLAIHAGAWTAFAEGSRAHGSVGYRARIASSAPNGEMRDFAEMLTLRTASEMTALAVGAMRAVPLPTAGLALDVGGALTARRYTLDRRIVASCPPNANCASTDPWPERTDVPGAAGLLALRLSLGPVIDVSAGGRVGTGRVRLNDPRDACLERMLIGNACPARTRWTRDVELTLGLAIGR